MRRSSRLSKRIIKKSIRNLFFSLVGIIVIIFLLIKFGIPALVNLSLFVSNLSSNNTESVNNNVFIPPPVLDIPYSATNSSRLRIEGTSSPDQTVLIYINGSIFDKVKVDDDGDFSTLVKLSSSNNFINAKTVNEAGIESAFSTQHSVFYKSEPPSLKIETPTEGQTFSGENQIIEVKGSTDSQVKITINGFWPQIDDENNFTYNFSLREGLNNIEVTAQDQAGNVITKTVSVTYYP